MNISVLESVILGLIQGLAEFLPISSSGHLTIFQELLGINPEDGSLLTFNILLHIATLFAVFAVYYNDIWCMIKAFFGMVHDLFTERSFGFEKDEYRRLVVMLVIGTIPAVFSALLLEDLIANPPIWFVGVLLYVTAVLLFISDRFKPGTHNFESLPFLRALGTGCFQAVAVLPGISRSGSTIVGGLLFGMKREIAVRFSFLLSIPAILGALVMDLPEVVEIMTTGGDQGAGALAIIAGMVVAAVSGYASIKLLLAIVRKSRMIYFSIYCAIAGTLTILLHFFPIH